jgi:hypothetical protein
VYYPADIQAAEARLHGQDMSSTAVGGVSMDGSLQSGTLTTTAGTRSIYFGH